MNVLCFDRLVQSDLSCCSCSRFCLWLGSGFCRVSSRNHTTEVSQSNVTEVGPAIVMASFDSNHSGPYFPTKLASDSGRLLGPSNRPLEGAGALTRAQFSRSDTSLRSQNYQVQVVLRHVKYANSSRQLCTLRHFQRDCQAS